MEIFWELNPLRLRLQYKIWSVIYTISIQVTSMVVDRDQTLEIFNFFKQKHRASSLDSTAIDVLYNMNI